MAQIPTSETSQKPDTQRSPVGAAQQGATKLLMQNLPRGRQVAASQEPGPYWAALLLVSMTWGKPEQINLFKENNPQTKTKPSVKNKGCSSTDFGHLGANGLLSLKTCAIRIIQSHNKAIQKSYSAIKTKAAAYK